jgi:DNA-binding response OmpR family regulator
LKNGRSAVGSILVADDDKTCRDSIQKVLEREGYHVESAGDVDSALEALRARPFDLVVCDYRMPGKTGMDLIQELKRRESAVPVLMISAWADPATEAHALELGAQMMKKPIRRKDLIDRTARYLGG